MTYAVDTYLRRRDRSGREGGDPDARGETRRYVQIGKYRGRVTRGGVVLVIDGVTHAFVSEDEAYDFVEADEG